MYRIRTNPILFPHISCIDAGNDTFIERGNKHTRDSCGYGVDCTDAFEYANSPLLKYVFRNSWSSKSAPLTNFLFVRKIKKLVAADIDKEADNEQCIDSIPATRTYWKYM